MKNGNQKELFIQFEKKANKKHNNLYSYDIHSYENSRKKISIFCKIHGKFEMTPDAHLRGQGCKICGKQKFLNTQREESLKRIKNNLKSVTNDVVSILEDSFFTLSKQAKFICSIHGSFEKRSFDALLNNPCNICSKDLPKKKKYSDLEAFNFVKSKLLSQITVKPFVYNGKNTIIELQCDKHGIFSVKFSSTHRTIKCNSCSLEATKEKRMLAIQKKNNEKKENETFPLWLEKSKIYHQNKYDYSLVNYQNMRTKVQIICPHHGIFPQTPEMHLTSGCRKCADDLLFGLYSDEYFEKFPERKEISAILYYISFEYENKIAYKVGITKQNVKLRFSSANKYLKIKSIFEHQTTLFNAFNIERIIQNEHGKKFRVEIDLSKQIIREARIGPTECFSEPISESDLNNYISKIETFNLL